MKTELLIEAIQNHPSEAFTKDEVISFINIFYKPSKAEVVENIRESFKVLGNNFDLTHSGAVEFDLSEADIVVNNLELEILNEEDCLIFDQDILVECILNEEVLESLHPYSLELLKDIIDSCDLVAEDFISIDSLTYEWVLYRGVIDINRSMVEISLNVTDFLKLVECEILYG